MTARVLRGEAPTVIGESRAAQPRVHVGLLPRTTPKPYEVPVHLFDTITDYIVKNASSVQDVFEAWDKDKNKLLDKREFRDFLNAIGFMVPKEASDAVFNEFDDDDSGGGPRLRRCCLSTRPGPSMAAHNHTALPDQAS